MRTTACTTLILTLLAGTPAIAQPVFGERPLLQLAGALSTELAPSVALWIETSTAPPDRLRSAVFAPPYWQRLRTEQQAYLMRFGLQPVGGSTIGSFEADEAVVLNPGARASRRRSRDKGLQQIAGLRWEQESFFLPGDRIDVHAVSEAQLLASQMGLNRSPEQAEMLALLGWRSRLQVHWQLGEPERQIQWQIVSRLDRRRDEANEMIQLQATRRF
jgi:hypothetical protein